MRYKEEDVQELIDNIDIAEVIGEYVNLKRQGESYKGLCPFHEDKTPSFSVSPSRGLYKCFGCNAAGNAVGFYMRYNSLEYIEAVEELAKKYNYRLRQENITQREIQYSKEKQSLIELMNKSMDFFTKNLFSKEGKEALEYLKNRGLGVELIKKYNLGFAINDWSALLNYLTELGYEEEFIFKAGLIKKGDKNYYDTFRNRVIFTIFSPKGEPIAFGGRIMNDKGDIAKYLNSPETKIFEKRRNLYGYIKKGSKIRKKGFTLLMEGYMDVLAAHNVGFENSVASLGTSLTEEQVKLLKRVTENVVICYDMDSAGRDATERAIFLLKKYEMNIKVLTLDDGKDPDEYIKKFGLSEFTKQLKKSKEAFDYIYETYSMGVDFSDVISKKIFVEKFKSFFENITNKIEFNTYLDKLSANIDVPKEDLMEIFKVTKINRRESRLKKTNQLKKYNKLELETTRLILLNPKYLDEFNINKIQDEFLLEILDFISKNRNNDNVYVDLLHEPNFEDKKQSIIELIYSLDDIENEKCFFEELKEQWEKCKIEEKDKEIKERMKAGGISEEERKKLQYERFLIIKSLKNRQGE